MFTLGDITLTPNWNKKHVERFIVIWQRILQLTFSSDKATRYFSELIGSLGTCQFYQNNLFIVLMVILMNSFLWGGCGSGDRAKRWSPNLLDHLQWNHKNTHKNNRDGYLCCYGPGKERMSQWKISAYKGLNPKSGHAPNETALVSMVSYLLPDLDQGSHWAPDSLRCNLAET